MSLLKKAMQMASNLINTFTLNNCKKKNQSKENVECRAQKINQHGSDNGDQYFYFRLLENNDTLETFLNDIKQDPLMKIRFHENRTTFLSQHLALSYIKQHNLVKCFINHKFYEGNIPEIPMDINNHLF